MRSLARALVTLSVWVMRALSPRGQARLAALIAWLGWTLGIRRRVTRDNLAAAFPGRPRVELDAIGRGAYRAMALAAIEGVSSDLVPGEVLERQVHVSDWKGLDVLLREGRPVLLASAHFGSWERFAEVMARRGYRFSAVVRPLSGAFNEWVVENRRRAGVEVLSERGSLGAMLRALRAGRAVVQLVDQALPRPEALEVSFFGRPATMTPALSLAALRSGAPVYVVLAARAGDRLEMTVEGPIAVPDAPAGDGGSRRAAVRARLTAHAQAVSDVIERAVRERPEQWLWLHRRWKPRAR